MKMTMRRRMAAMRQAILRCNMKNLFKNQPLTVENVMTTLTYNQHRKPVSGIKNLLNRIGHCVSVYLANFSVAMAWKSGRRADPADLDLAGFTSELEDQVIESMKTQYAR